jgi:putative ABC transport system permease protein
VYARLLTASFRRAPRRKLVALLVLVLGTGTAAGLASLAVSAQDAMGREFRSIGANFRLTPAAAAGVSGVGGVESRDDAAAGFLPEKAVAELEEPAFFWRRNVTAMTPTFAISARLNGSAARVTGAWFARELRGSDGGALTTGLPQIYPSWHLDGRWPAGSEVALGTLLARRLRLRAGDDARLDYAGRQEPVRVSGIVRAGGAEDAEAVAPLALVQHLAGRPGQAREALVSAVTTPESRVLAQTGFDPQKLSKADYDRWYCTNYPSSIAHRIEVTLPGVVASPIRRAVETEGRVLGRLNGLMWGSALAALMTAALGMVSTIFMTLIERRREIGLLKALGAEDATISALFVSEALALGLIGGLAGWLLGQLIGYILSRALFGTAMIASVATLPIALGASAAIVLLSTLAPVRAALRWDPIAALHGA